MSTKQSIRAACGMLTSKTSVTKALLNERARDLAGCVSGPTDLSVNKDYLRGFGMLMSKTSVTKALLKERAKDKKREEAKLKRV